MSASSNHEYAGAARAAESFRSLAITLIASLFRGIAAWHQRVRLRHEYRQLLMAPPHVLKDIGITRDDILAGLDRLERSRH
ncbi:MAG TPA: DUF1127 domain-containing protein [Paracoccaceae bacterium]|nr:DUF1127 domain-containing protein [Paracoccaceae bacterium]